MYIERLEEMFQDKSKKNEFLQYLSDELAKEVDGFKLSDVHYVLFCDGFKMRQLKIRIIRTSSYKYGGEVVQQRMIENIIFSDYYCIVSSSPSWQRTLTRAFRRYMLKNFGEQYKIDTKERLTLVELDNQQRIADQMEDFNID